VSVEEIKRQGPFLCLLRGAEGIKGRSLFVCLFVNISKKPVPGFLPGCLGAGALGHVFKRREL
jgi:hypothetical protein